MKEKQPHERHNPAHPLLRELVLVHVDGTDGAFFDVLLTRVPGIGEEIIREDRYYKVLRVQHESVDDDGRARFGWHAFVDADLLPLDEEIIGRKRKTKKSKRKEDKLPF
jgi:hypothetical protein